MVSEGELLLWIVIWFSIGMVLVVGRWRAASGVGLVSAFGLQMLILHWLAAAIYVLPWYWNLDVNVVFAGLQESTYAMGGFTIGVLAITWSRRRHALEMAETKESIADHKIIQMYLAIGVGSYFVLAPFFSAMRRNLPLTHS